MPMHAQASRLREGGRESGREQTDNPRVRECGLYHWWENSIEAERRSKDRTATDDSGGSIHCAARSWPDLAFPPMPQDGQMDARLCATGAAQEGDPSSFPIPQERGGPS